jgi:hypothetical protein
VFSSTIGPPAASRAAGQAVVVVAAGPGQDFVGLGPVVAAGPGLDFLGLGPVVAAGPGQDFVGLGPVVAAGPEKYFNKNIVYFVQMFTFIRF